MTVGERNIHEVTQMAVRDALDFFAKLGLAPTSQKIARQILKEISAHSMFMKNVGLDYLTLERRASTLSGGEAQRIRLATQIGSSLVGVLYILDEPTIGLHQRDNALLIDTLKHLRDIGNTLIVVEHDEQTLRTADYIVDLGPGCRRARRPRGRRRERRGSLREPPLAHGAIPFRDAARSSGAASAAPGTARGSSCGARADTTCRESTFIPAGHPDGHHRASRPGSPRSCRTCFSPALSNRV